MSSVIEAALRNLIPKAQPEDGVRIQIDDPFLFLDVKAFIMAGDAKQITLTMIERDGVSLKKPEELVFAGRLKTFRLTGGPQTPLALPNNETSYRYDGYCKSAVLLAKFADSYKGTDHFEPSYIFDTRINDYNGELKTWSLLSYDQSQGRDTKHHKTKIGTVTTTTQKSTKSHNFYASANLYISATLDHRRIRVDIFEGKGLKASDFRLIGKPTSDPYVVMKVPGASRKYTKVIKKNLNPKWNESFDISWPTNKPLEDITLNIMDKDIMSKDDPLGQVVIRAADIEDAGGQMKDAADTHKRWIPISINGVASSTNGELLVCATTYTMSELQESGHIMENGESKDGFIRSCFDGLRMSEKHPVKI